MEKKLKKKLKKLYNLGNYTYSFVYQTKAFQRRYKSIDSSMFKNSIDPLTIEQYKKRWQAICPLVEINTLKLCHNLSNRIDLDIVPENIFAAIIEPKLNTYKNKELSFLSVKNIYEQWFNNSEVFPQTYFHKIDDIFYDNKFNIIKDLNSFLDRDISDFKFPLICKPSLGTAGGEGVKVLNNIESIKESINDYSNLVFQELIVQHDFLQNIYPNINSVRVCLYRTKDGKFKVINNSIRFGVNGSLDNLKSGGIVCDIDSNGLFNNYAVSMYCKKFFRHPNTNVQFSGKLLPKYENLLLCAENIANQIPLANLVSLDMCLDSKGNWRCLEINLDSQTIRFRQYAGYGFFGEYTDEVIERVLASK